MNVTVFGGDNIEKISCRLYKKTVCALLNISAEKRQAQISPQIRISCLFSLIISIIAIVSKSGDSKTLQYVKFVNYLYILCCSLSPLVVTLLSGEYYFNYSNSISYS